MTRIRTIVRNGEIKRITKLGDFKHDRTHLMYDLYIVLNKSLCLKQILNLCCIILLISCFKTTMYEFQ